MDSKQDKALSEALSRMILSASGWRGIFSENGDEESPGEAISPSHRIITAGAAKVFADYVGTLGKNGNIIIGRDTRPTGEAIAQVLLQILLALGKESTKAIAYAVGFQDEKYFYRVFRNEEGITPKRQER
jgi:AraC-like DNA-binding protein